MSNVVEKLMKMIEEANIEVTDLQKLVALKGTYKETDEITSYKEDFILRSLIPNWKKIVETIKKNKGEQQ